MIVFFCSPMGSGKTLALTLFGYVCHKTGIMVYSNYPVKFPHIPVEKPEEIELISNGVFLGDELWNWIDARTSMKNKNTVISKILLQSRKRNFHILHTAQFKSQPDKRLREHTDIFGIPSFDKTTNMCSISFYEYMGHDRVVAVPISSYKFDGSKVFDLYDSYSGLYSSD